MNYPIPDHSALFGADSQVYRGIPSSSALEVAFPAVELSKIAENESWRKEVHRPATSTHKWWAKRLGSVFRGIMAAAVTEAEDDAFKTYSSPVDLRDLVVFDPFAGSGTTVVEAAKLGASVIGSDINPVATLVQRQAVQCWDVSELHRAFKLVESNCREEIDRVHRTETGETVLYYFWVAVASCPHCAARTRLFSTHVFSQNAYPKRVPDAQLVCPECLDVQPGRYDFQLAKCRNGHEFGRAGAVNRTQMTCPNGHISKVLDALGGEIPEREMYAKIVLGRDGKKRYEPINAFDRSLYAECVDLLSAQESDLVLPVGRLDVGENTRQAMRWGFVEWRQFFNERQLYSLGLLGSAIRDVKAGYAEREALVALFSGTLEFNNMFCSFKGEGTGAVRHMFSHHILKPERMPLEAHPWGSPASSGSFSTLFRSRILRAHEYKTDPVDQLLVEGGVQRVTGVSLPFDGQLVTAWPEQGLGHRQVYIRNGDSSRTDLPPASVDLVVTDPPYMDNVHYSELADFFHAWLMGMKPFSDYPYSEETTRSSEEVQSADPREFGDAISRVWKECERVLKPGGLLAFTFHQARLTGWVSLVEALANAGLGVTAIQPIKGEMSTSVTKGGKEPSNLDSIIVCRRSGEVPPGDDSPEAAAARGEQLLAELQKAGIQVGVGDVKSVIRGHVLATYTLGQDTELAALAELADSLASASVTRLCGAAKPA
ncbi:DNA methyltransferase [Streptomyces wuyuanensis]|uniref:Adenine-specific DNA methylase, contains a Zn-ribbon domain n=1 Tax=Streptomyces wuyuanensis TaxID=1196353 RepID=A0A1G9PSY1_9ACTN|nr:DNA methyltransferase [Streptomyces wuyuanensis]SDM01235.1 Adenine-specific DNA methylase, contains a Zn-ribbon domain [Streptomyces wuyuanensis]